MNGALGAEEPARALLRLQLPPGEGGGGLRSSASSCDPHPLSLTHPHLWFRAKLGAGPVLWVQGAQNFAGSSPEAAAGREFPRSAQIQRQFPRQPVWEAVPRAAGAPQGQGVRQAARKRRIWEVGGRTGIPTQLGLFLRRKRSSPKPLPDLMRNCFPGGLGPPWRFLGAVPSGIPTFVSSCLEFPAGMWVSLCYYSLQCLWGFLPHCRGSILDPLRFAEAGEGWSGQVGGLGSSVDPGTWQRCPGKTRQKGRAGAKSCIRSSQQRPGSPREGGFSGMGG